MKDKITVLKIENLKEFEGHPYKVTDNEEMEALALSIKENGILSPVVVRPLISTAVWLYEGSRKQKEMDHRPRSRKCCKGRFQDVFRRQRQ